MNTTESSMVTHLATLRDHIDMLLRETSPVTRNGATAVRLRNAQRALADYTAEYRARGYTVVVPDAGTVSVD